MGRGPCPAEIATASDKALRICLVSSEFAGPFHNGGIGTAYTQLAHLLTEAGHDVTLLYTNSSFPLTEPIEHWVEYFRVRGMGLVLLPESPVPVWSISPNLSVSYRVYRWFRDHDRFDIVHFPEYLGHGYYTLAAQRQGLILQPTATVVGLHSPTSWVLLANDRLASAESELEDNFIERRSADLADIVWSPSRYMLEWVRQQGWDLPASAQVRPLVVPASPCLAPVTTSARPVHEIVFFGRQELRKGLFLFLAAIDRLIQSWQGLEQANLAITILGKPTGIDGRDSQRIIAERSRDWPFAVQVLPDRDHEQALAYLRGAGRLAVIPSLIENYPNTVLECLAYGVPFLASRVGGIPEQVAVEDLERVCFEPKPEALAQRLHRALSHGHAPARLAFDPVGHNAGWVRWHEQLPGQRDQLRAAAGWSINSGKVAEPTISVCIAHYGRPHYLRQALRSIAEQDSHPLEVIVVDDGSPGVAVQCELDWIEQEFDFAGRGWRLIRQANRYLGAARNRAAAAARGDYLLFMDDDNLAKPEEIATFAAAARHSGADLITCLQDAFEGPDAPMPPGAPRCRWLFAGANLPLSVLYNTFGDANALCRRAAFLEVGGFTEDYGVTHEDWELFVRLMLGGYRTTVIPEALFWYRLTPMSMIKSTPLRANYARSLRPHLEHLPRIYYPLIEMILGHSLRTRHSPKPAEPEPPPPPPPPLRYRVVDVLNARLKQLRPVHRLARSLVHGMLALRALLRGRSVGANRAGQEELPKGAGEATPRGQAPASTMMPRPKAGAAPVVTDYPQVIKVTKEGRRVA
jgi:glycosyltransferase involved in cell wall biosynthesis